MLQVDGYAGYGMLAERNAVSLAFCWSHVRRRFYELAQAGPAPIATEALARIAELYQIEGELRGRSAEERCAVRKVRSRTIIDALEPWLKEKLEVVSQKSKLAEAIRYALSRKNALFAGSDGGTEHWAVIASLVETCKLNAVDPHLYLADANARIVEGHPQSQLDDLLPRGAYAPAPLKAVA